MKQFSSEGLAFAAWFKSTLPETTNLQPNWQTSFAKVYDDMVRLDKRSPEQIKAVSAWARSDSFWRKNFMSPAKLRDRKNGIQWFDTFAEMMKSPSATPPQQTANTAAVNTGRRKGNPQAPNPPNQ